jgi:hypothetical protein
LPFQIVANFAAGSFKIHYRYIFKVCILDYCMLKLDEFLEGQQKIYDNNFRGKKDLVRNEGVLNGVDKVTGGYLVVFRYDSFVSNALGRLSHQIVRAAPEGVAMPYPARIVHSTLSDCGIEQIDEFRRDEDVLRRLTSAVSNSVGKIRAPKMGFGDVIYNQTASVLEGNPDNAFVDAVNEVISESKKEGIKLREPWGAHTTLSRFIKESPDMLEFSRKIDGLRFGQREASMPCLDIGTFVFGPCGLLHENYKRFELD